MDSGDAEHFLKHLFIYPSLRTICSVDEPIYWLYGLVSDT